MPNPQDPIYQSIDMDLSEGLTDPSRAAQILRMLPRLVTETPNLRPIQTGGGLPETGEESMADMAALAGQGPSGIGGDVRMGTKLGDIYAQRAELRQRGDILSNAQELTRTGQENEMARARSVQALGALNFVQEDRKLAHQIQINRRLLAQDGRMRLEFMMENAPGAEDSPVRRAYTESVMAMLRDPTTRATLANPDTGIDAMINIMDKARASARGGMSPRAERAIGTAAALPNVPQTAPTGMPAATVTPEQQAERDVVAQTIRGGEDRALPGQDPSAAGAAAVTGPEIVQPQPPQLFRGQRDYESDQKYGEARQAWNIAEQTRWRSEQTLASAQRGEQRSINKEQRALENERVDVSAAYENAAKDFDATIDAAKRLRDHKGTKWIIGRLGSLATAQVLPGSGMDALSVYRQVRSQTLINGLMEMKAASKTGASGFGQLNKTEADSIQDARAALARAQTEDSFKAALTRYINQLERSKANITRGYLGHMRAIGGEPVSGAGAPKSGITWDELIRPR